MMSQQSVHEFTINTIDGESKNLSDFKGKKMLFVNTASQCGFTPQYMELQELHEKHGDELVIIGFPANNFGGQEPGSNDQIKTFCQKNYGVSFMLSEKVSVKGKNIDPIFKWLNAQDNQSFKGDIMWNFEKYLIDESGKLIKRYRSMTKPDSDKIISLI
ncbi:MAG: glutathione peroxidase [Crocinitomicaceae bacterium]|nr:MAG: glutathione peroxidase [Crocinitomicaceae bacterium]